MSGTRESIAKRPQVLLSIGSRKASGLAKRKGPKPVERYFVAWPVSGPAVYETGEMIDRDKPAWLSLFGELIAALAVMALLVLSFGQATPANSVFSSAALAQGSEAGIVYCGGGPGGDGQSCLSPCHACRPDTVGLPPPPGVAEPVRDGLDLPPGPKRAQTRPHDPASMPPEARASPISV